MYQALIQSKKKDFDSIFTFAQQEAAALRTGRAHSSIVSDIPVEYLGSRLTVKELASITVPEPRTIFIQPWDKGALSAIEAGIRASTLGLNPVVDGTTVRLNIPPLTEERRKELVRTLHSKMEEARIRIRQVREDILKKVQTAVREKEAREDDLRHAKDAVQKVVDELHEKIDTLARAKEQELMQS
ncbi:MAG: ribosome recycling factor [Candidatus Paceibacterota bacterium]|nr:MAG: ribosome recycling factor [Candidatus Paceibacterota bacterium]